MKGIVELGECVLCHRAVINRVGDGPYVGGTSLSGRWNVPENGPQHNTALTPEQHKCFHDEERAAA